MRPTLIGNGRSAAIRARIALLRVCDIRDFEVVSHGCRSRSMGLSRLVVGAVSILIEIDVLVFEAAPKAFAEDVFGVAWRR